MDTALGDKHKVMAGSSSCPQKPRFTSARSGILAEEEERLYRLRQDLEGEARARLFEEKAKLEEESRSTQVRAGLALRAFPVGFCMTHDSLTIVYAMLLCAQAGKLCATPFGVDIVGITEFVALVSDSRHLVTCHNLACRPC
jgi:hypothetical protein